MNCNLCPNKCNIDREKKVGFCSVNDKIKIAKFYLHPYEEPFISGKNGSGTVFFCGCSLKCVFCQNYEVSRNIRGKEITINELAEIFKKLEDMGASNINLVSPTHYIDKIVKALDVYKPNIPIVYNSHGYENIETLKKIDEYIDIYLPDIKFFSPTMSKRYCGKENYFSVASRAIEFMANKPLTFNEDMLKTGTVVRHLVLPQNTSDSKKILDWFSDSNLKEKAYINIMSQYTPLPFSEEEENLK
ncbi:MAG: radical SAM protein, partial [Clostridia bacterium]|nr:radical SAM protein [Clostridia bacterium]